ncbi:hypothetical protein [Burkholderia sp. LS-044]|uniref:hypothetical protein n=1 Tax=Burkholderia sp. LS-044 TaxID=1459967 RepID=UPI00200045F5|nr:hypothetical protein [Burkholderia sp. LS-044]
MHTALEQQHAAAPSAIHGFLTRIVDITMIALGTAAAAWFSPGDGIDPSDNVAIVASTAVFAMILFPAFGVARIPRDRATCRIVFLTVSAWLLALAGSAIVMFAMRGALPVPPSGFLLWATASGIALVAFRLAVCATLERIVHVGERTRPVAIGGGGAHCAAVLERIAQSPSARYRAAALLDPDRCAQPGANGIEALFHARRVRRARAGEYDPGSLDRAADHRNQRHRSHARYAPARPRRRPAIRSI